MGCGGSGLTAGLQANELLNSTLSARHPLGRLGEVLVTPASPIAAAGPRGVLTVACSLWRAHRGVLTVACSPWCAHCGVLTVACSQLPPRSQPAEVAALICFLASDEASFITAQGILVDGGYTAC